MNNPGWQFAPTFVGRSLELRNRGRLQGFKGDPPILESLERTTAPCNQVSPVAYFSRASLATAAASAAQLFAFPNILHAAKKGDKLRFAVIGCGGRGMNHLDWLVNQSKENLVAIVDAGREAASPV